jgi:DNA repair protein SbcC/Rad50
VEIRSLSLRNYRVFQELELEVPPGLVGIYGANGSGKSTLLEAITWALYGRARTSKQSIATSGTTGECVVELGLDHEEHHYVIRRTISGINHTVKARVTAGGQIVADGPTEVGRYVRSILGMDEHAFRSSVFAEQKQLAAFSDHTADHRRRLVLSLLGITPIEKARDEARSDARTAEKDYARLTATLPDAEELLARSEAVQVLIGDLESASRIAEEALQEANSRRKSLHEAVRQGAEAKEKDSVIRAKGQAARAHRDGAFARLQDIEREEEEIQLGGTRITQLQTLLADFDDAIIAKRLMAIDRVEGARRNVARVSQSDQSALAEEPAPQALRKAEHDARAAGLARADAEAATKGLARELAAVQERLRAASSLTDDLPCPTCGQDISGGVTAVLDHFQSELDQSTRRHAESEKVLASARRQEVAAIKVVDTASKALRTAEQRWEASRKARAALDAAQRALEESMDGLGGQNVAANEVEVLTERRRNATTWKAEMDRLLGKRERLARLGAERQESEKQLAAADELRRSLRAELDALAFDAPAYATLTNEAAKAEDLADQALRTSRDKEASLMSSKRELAMINARIEQAAEQRAQLAGLASSAVLIGRTAELLNGFRQAVVASVGPRLSIQASELFRLLTGNEYDGLHVDPETYEIQVIDQGVTYPTARFSGSEVDLANLALRVAISEQVRFQAGGQVGLLVLDEALASLDGERKDRMLMALTQLSARFRQILVVTHAVEVKEQLPQAIEVLKIGLRRSTARVIDGS